MSAQLLLLPGCESFLQVLVLLHEVLLYSLVSLFNLTRLVYKALLHLVLLFLLGVFHCVQVQLHVPFFLQLL